MTGLTQAQIEALLQPIHSGRVGTDPRGNSHVEAWDIRRYLLRVFGWGGWDFEVVSCDLVSEGFRPHPSEERAKKGDVQYTVVYRVIGRLIIRSPEGEHVAHFEDGATGDATNQPSLGDAHDMALKTALSQALKRCAANLGDAFGLSLYNDGKTDPVVRRTVGCGAPPPDKDPRPVEAVAS